MVSDCLQINGFGYAAWFVLILVLMEYGLGRNTYTTAKVFVIICLNPCFNGIWSRTMLLNHRFNLILLKS